MSEDNEVTAESSIVALNIEPDVAEAIGVDTSVQELANVEATRVVEETDLEQKEVAGAVAQARDAVGIDKPVDIYTMTESTTTVDAEVETFEDPDEFIAEIDDTDGDDMIVDINDPEECETVALIGPNDGWDEDGLHAAKEPEDNAAMIEQRLEEFGFENVDQFVTTKTGMGVTAVRDYYSVHKNQGNSDKLLPVTPVSAKDYKTSDNSWADAYQARNAEILDRVDGVCVFANGGDESMIGLWVNMVIGDRDDFDDERFAEVCIETPPQKGEEQSSAFDEHVVDE